MNCQSNGLSSTIEYQLNAAIASWNPILGCLDSLAMNYNSSANIDDGSCNYTSYTVKSVGMNFSPDTIICNIGDTINFILGQSHNAVEVDQNTFLSNGISSNGGFYIGYGQTGSFIPINTQTHYYICQPHVSSGMRGVIIVNPIPVDCNGDNYGLAWVDSCGNCVGGNTVGFPSLPCIEFTPSLNVDLSDKECNVISDLSFTLQQDAYEPDISSVVISSNGGNFNFSGLNINDTVGSSVNVAAGGSLNANTTLFVDFIITNNKISIKSVDNITGQIYSFFTVENTSSGILLVATSLPDPNNVTQGNNQSFFINGLFENLSPSIIIFTSTITSELLDVEIQTSILTIDCTDCNGDFGGLAFIDTCGICVAGNTLNSPCILTIYGCTDSLALNYDPTATTDDGSCTYPVVCTNPVATGLYTDEIIHSRARVHWDNMTSATCLPYKYKIWYREVGTSSWSTKTAQDAGLCQFGLGTTSKMISGLTSGTTYEWQIKSYYCGTTGASVWSALQTFTTADECANVINFAVATPTPTKAVFTWDTTAAYSFVRIKLRVDSISNPMGTDWFSAGGFGVNYPALTRNKNGLTAGQTYRGQAKTWCDPNGGLYRATSWTPLVFWTQPNTIRLEGGTVINNLDVYPNPSRDIFNVNFTSEDIQNLEVRIINVIGEVVYTENLNQFVGEYTKQVDLSTYTKGVYFLEITTDNGVINKKLILQ